VRGFWFTDCQFIPDPPLHRRCKQLLRAIARREWLDIHWRPNIRAENLDQEN